MPNYYNRVDWRGADRDEASAIYDYARHLCAEQGITNPRPSLVQALVEQAFPDS